MDKIEVGGLAWVSEPWREVHRRSQNPSTTEGRSHLSPAFPDFLSTLPPTMSTTLIIPFKKALLERQGIKEGRETDFPSVCSLPKWPQWPGPGQAKTASQELHPSLQHGWQGPTHVSHHLLPSLAC